MESCHNCGLPMDCVTSEGYRLKLPFKAENRFKRDSTKSVWCCSDECSIQALAIAKYGPSTHKWPLTLAQFRSTKPLKDRTRAETISEDRINIGVFEGLFEVKPSEDDRGISARKKKVGRPRKWSTESERHKVYRRSK